MQPAFRPVRQNSENRFHSGNPSRPEQSVPASLPEAYSMESVHFQQLAAWGNGTVRKCVPRSRGPPHAAIKNAHHFAHRLRIRCTSVCLASTTNSLCTPPTRALDTATTPSDGPWMSDHRSSPMIECSATPCRYGNRSVACKMQAVRLQQIDARRHPALHLVAKRTRVVAHQLLVPHDPFRPLLDERRADPADASRRLARAAMRRGDVNHAADIGRRLKEKRRRQIGRASPGR